MSGIFDAEKNEWTPSEDSDWKWVNIHPETVDCFNYGCVVHYPSYWPGADWPYFPRIDGRMERICPHGVGHPDPDVVMYLVRVAGWSPLAADTHGCDGCCRG